MFNQVMWLAIPTFIFSIIIMWESFQSMIHGKSIKNFLPFFCLTLALSFYAGAISFELFFNSLWAILESAILLSLVWIFINIWRNRL